jgi:hypothetical protein
VNNQFYMKQMKKKVHVPFPALTAGFLWYADPISNFASHIICLYNYPFSTSFDLL